MYDQSASAPDPHPSLQHVSDPHPDLIPDSDRDPDTSDPDDRDTSDTVNLDIATSTAARPPAPHRTILIDRYYRPGHTAAPRPPRKRVSSPQNGALRRQLQQAARLSPEYRIVDYSDSPRDRGRQREKKKGNSARLFEPDMEEDPRPISEEDFPRISPEDEFGESIEPNDDDLEKDKEPLSSSSPRKHHQPESLPARKFRKPGGNRSMCKYRSIEESPYQNIVHTCPSQCAADARVYDAYTEAVQKESRAHGGGLRKIVELLRDSEGNPIVIEKAALVIGILSENDAASRDAFGHFAAVQTLIQCLSMRISAKFDRTVIVKTVTFALASLLKDSPKNLRLFEMFDGPYKMGKAAASERYENIPEVPKNALKALCELKYHPQSADGVTNHVLTNSSTNSRTIMYVLRSMSLHEYRAEIQECGLDAVRTLLARAGRGTIHTALLSQISQTAATAFKMHEESQEVQWQCLTIFCDMDALREDMFSLRLDMEAFFGSFQALISDLKDNTKRKPEVQKSIVGLLKRAIEVTGNVGWRSTAFVEEAVEAGGVEAMLSALDFFGSDSRTSDKICSILRKLLQSDEGRFRMSRVKSACAILDGIANSNERAAVTLSS